MLFKNAVAVGEIAIGAGKFAQFTRLAIQRSQAVEDIFDLHAIGTNVLHWRSADGTGNQAEVFQADQALLQGVLHKRMPWLARFGFNHHLYAVFNNADATAGHAQHQGLNVASQQQVATTANYQQRHLALFSDLQSCAHVGVAVGLGKQGGLYLNAKTVKGF